MSAFQAAQVQLIALADFAIVVLLLQLAWFSSIYWAGRDENCSKYHSSRIAYTADEWATGLFAFGVEIILKLEFLELSKLGEAKDASRGHSGAFGEPWLMTNAPLSRLVQSVCHE